MTQEPLFPADRTVHMQRLAADILARHRAEFAMCWCGDYLGEHDATGQCSQCGCCTYAEASDAWDPPLTAPRYVRPYKGIQTVTVRGGFL